VPPTLLAKLPMAQPKRKEREPAETPDKPAPGQAAAPGVTVWSTPTWPSRPTTWVLLGLVLLLNVPLIHYFVFRAQVPASVSVPFADDFSNPGTVEQNYGSIGGLWRTVNGELLSPGVKNNPLWLKASLPADVAVDFDVRSMSPEGDIKVELFGDGTDHASGYVLIHGGWNNSLSIIARLDEHAPSLATLEAEARRRGGADLVSTGVYIPTSRVRVEANPYPVQVGRTYHWHIERRGGRLSWSIDGNPFMQFEDPYPLKGKWHDRFAFSSWEAQLYFDNLKIQPL
jgi:hypothetical protein